MNPKLLVIAVSMVSVICMAGLPTARAASQVVAESARKVPIAYDVDVVVVGGSTHAVAAATAAAKAGATVFLAAPKTYLGEDLCGTLRLWLDADDTPDTDLGRRLFAPPPAGSGAAPLPPAMLKGSPFTYETDQPSDGKHKDTAKPSLLRDGRYGAAPTQSVQYNQDVNITADLGSEQTVRKVQLLAYQRVGVFEVKDAAISLSSDKKTWKQAVIVPNKALGKGDFESTPVELAADIGQKARYVKVFVRKTEQSERMLLAELVIEADAAQPGAQLVPPKEEPKPQPPAKAEPATQPKAPAVRLTTPMHVKATLDGELLNAGVKFLYSCYATDVLRDGEGRPAGIVMANRVGRQAVLAKVIIDATDRATAARLVGASFRPYPAGSRQFKQVVIGGQPRTDAGISCRKIGEGYPMVGVGREGQLGATTGRAMDVIEYTLTLPMKDASFASFAAADQLARDMTWTPEATRVSEDLFEVPPDAMQAAAMAEGPWPGADKADLGAFRPAGVERMYVVGGCAGVARDVAARLLRPAGLIAIAQRIGAAAAAEAKAAAKPANVRLPGGPADGAAPGEVRELLVGVRPIQDLPSVPAEARGLPVLGRYDVVVIGGGTGGAPAAIAAARRGAKTLCVEYLSGLGGVSTLGLIGTYYHGYRGGFTSEIDEGVAAIGGAKGKSTKVDWKLEYYRREIRKAKGDIWFQAIGCGAVVQKGKVCGAVVATPLGRGVVLADVVIDGTGNADVAAAAGAKTIHTSGDFLAVQGTGLPPHALGANYTNTDYTFADETDMMDIWRLFLGARQKFRGSFDLGQLIDSRERRRIVGDVVLTILDLINQRKFPDVIATVQTNFDTHGYTVDPFFVPTHPESESIRAYVPFRCLTPAGWDGILVIGLGISVHRDAVPLIRMQPDVQNLGYAAGVAAAMASRSGGMVRDVDLKALQKHLIETGCIPEDAAAWKDSYPLSDEKLAEAIRNLDRSYHDVALVMSQKERAVPLLRKALAEAKEEKARLKYAHVLASCGDASGVDLLIAAVKAEDKWDKGWNFKGMGQFGQALSPLDRYIVALGLAGDEKAVPAIVAKAKLLTVGSEFSHHRAVALALEMLGEKSAAPALAEVLAQPGMIGHAMLKPAAESDRSSSLREIILARALYRLGDPTGLAAKVLKTYTQDLQGHFARHAHYILQAGGK